MTRPRLRVGVLGCGSVGGTVVEALTGGRIDGCELSGVLRREASGHDPRVVRSLSELLDSSDLVVEAAGQDAVREHGNAIIAAGLDLLVVSVGALAEDTLLDGLRAAGNGRVLVSTGAVGGVDVLRAAMRCGTLETVELVSRKAPGALMRPWMDAETIGRLSEGTEELEVFGGTAREASRRFPQTANVATTVGLCTVGLDDARVRIVAAPSGGSSHLVRARGPSGTYEIRVENRSAPHNPKTSWITPFAVIRALEDLCSDTVVI